MIKKIIFMIKKIIFMKRNIPSHEDNLVITYLLNLERR